MCVPANAGPAWMASALHAAAAKTQQCVTTRWR
jgi:hypothetical protein